MDDHASASRHVQLATLGALSLFALLVLASPGALRLGGYTVMAPLIALAGLLLVCSALTAHAASAPERHQSVRSGDLPVVDILLFTLGALFVLRLAAIYHG